MIYPSLDKRIPLLVLAVGLVTTYLLQQAAFKDARQIQQDIFAYQTREITLRIEQRLAAYEQILRGAKGLFVASKSIGRNGFRDYVANQRLEDHYPGIQGIGFSQIIPPQEKVRHVEVIRKEGFPNYTVWPEGERSLYTSIIYLEPFSGRNLRAFGYDMYSETVRRTAMEQARDLDKQVMSGKVRLVQETDQNVQAGFLMYVPVYRNGSPHETLADRRANIIGWAYAPFRMDDLMHGILGDRINDVDLEIYDGENATPETLMYDSNSAQNQYAPLYRSTRSIGIIGHEWAITLHSLPIFEANLDTGRVTVIRLTGILVSTLLSLLIWQLASGRERALNLAQDMTRELRESEATSRAIIEATPVPLALNDEQGNITYLNKAFIQTIGYTTDDVPTLSDWWSRAYPAPQYRQWAADSWQNHLEKAKRANEPFSSMELNIRCKDGMERTFMVGAASIKENFAGTHLVILYDITERKQAESELRTLSTAIEQSPLSVVITDLDANIQYVNPHFISTTGYSKEEAVGQNPRILQSGQTPKEIYVELWKALTSGQVWRGELINKRKNGEVYWEEAHIAPVIDSAGAPMLYVAVKLEITQRKQAEEALRQSEAKLHALYDTTSDAVMLLDGNGFFDCNKAALEVFGCATKEEFCSKQPTDLSPPEQPHGANSMTQTNQWVAAAMANGGNIFEWVHKRVDTGEVFPTDVLLNSMVLDGKLVLQATVRDITERKKYEEELKRSNAELEQFSYAVSHDMRQPLRMISSYLQLIEMSLADQLDGEKRNYFNFAIEGAKRIDQMLVALLEYSRAGRMGEPPAWIESREVLDEALQFLQPALDEAQAKLNIAGDWSRIMGSHDEILRLLQNLIGNAAKFRVAGRTPEITVSSEMVKNEWHLSVADNGVGIIPDQIKRLFQVFQRLQLRTAYEGNGVGLALCRKIAEHHKGRIWAESAGEGQGSKFCVVLPVQQEKAISARGMTT